VVRAPSARRAFRRRWAWTACERRRNPRSRLSSPRLRAANSCLVRVILVWAFQSLCWVRAEGRGLKPRERSMTSRHAGHRADGVTPRSRTPTPRSKPVTPTSRLVAQQRRRWHSSLGRGFWPQGPATYRHYSDCGVCGVIPKRTIETAMHRGAPPVAMPDQPNWSVTRVEKEYCRS
jgi:hypothetical protein